MVVRDTAHKDIKTKTSEGDTWERKNYVECFQLMFVWIIERVDVVRDEGLRAQNQNQTGLTGV